MTSRESAQGQVLNLPNVVTVLRLLLLAPVCWLLLAPTAVGAGWVIASMVLLVVWAGTDWADGFLARRLGLVSRFGALLDPVADRVGIAAIVLALAISSVLPWWLPVIVLGIDLVVVPLAGPAARRGTIAVSGLGKVRTAVMLIGIVGLVVAAGLDSLGVPAAAPLIAIFRIVVLIGTLLHLIAGIDYVRQARRRRPRTANHQGNGDTRSQHHDRRPTNSSRD